MNEQEFKAFREAALPLMQWLADNRHPHVTVIVDSERAELLEGQANARRVSKEHELDKLEKALAETAHTAFAQARQIVLEANLPVLQSEDGTLYRVHPDGTKQPIKTLEPLFQTPARTICLE